MVRFDNFKPQYRSIKSEVDRAIGRVLVKGWFILGEEVSRFEQELAAYVGTRYAVGVASGTEAIALSLMALGIGPGDEVITTAMTAFPTITGIMQAGARPVVVDVCAENGLIDVDEIESKINRRSAALLPVHLYGQSCAMDRIAAIAKKHGLPVVEDCAQSCGTNYQGRHTGTWGRCGAFSFYPTKNLGAYGDAGAVVTDDRRLSEKLRRLRNYGQRDRYRHPIFGLNSRLDELQAAVLRVKLRHLDAWNRRRREIADHYRRQLRTVSCLREVLGSRSNYHLFVVKSPDRERLLAHLRDQGVQTLIHYPFPVHRQRAFPGPKGGSCPRSERFARMVLSLPIYPELSERNQKRVIEAVNGFTS
jgi:dTDP-4-amino-4,6-dideoxygalactose transaminase